MKEKDQFYEFEQLLQQARDLSKQMEAMKDDISALLVENAELKIENENLRNKVDTDTVSVSGAHQNLEKLYNKGYHICRPFYGSHRKADEGCAFCLGILNETDNKSKAN